MLSLIDMHSITLGLTPNLISYLDAMERRITDQLFRLHSLFMSAPSPQGAPQVPITQPLGTSLASLPSPDDLKPCLSAKQISRLPGAPTANSREIGLTLTNYSLKHGYQVTQNGRSTWGVNLYCRAAVAGCFGMRLS